MAEVFSSNESEPFSGIETRFYGGDMDVDVSSNESEPLSGIETF